MPYRRCHRTSGGSWHVLVEENSTALDPVIERVGAGKSAVPVLLRTIACDALVTPTA
jgi:hypothetical protein